MAVSSKIFGPLTLSLFSGEVNYLGGTAKSMLTTSAYVPDQDTHRYLSSVTNEITGTGYTAGGETLVSKTANYDTETNTLTLDADDLSWAGATFTFRHIVFYIDTGTAGTSPLIAWHDMGVDVSVTATSFTYLLPAGGVAQFTVAA